MSALDDAAAMFAAADRLRVARDDYRDRALLPESIVATLRDIGVAREHGFYLDAGIGWVRFDDPDSDFFRWEAR